MIELERVDLNVLLTYYLNYFIYFKLVTYSRKIESRVPATGVSLVVRFIHIKKNKAKEVSVFICGWKWWKWISVVSVYPAPGEIYASD